MLDIIGRSHHAKSTGYAMAEAIRPEHYENRISYHSTAKSLGPAFATAGDYCACVHRVLKRLARSRAHVFRAVFTGAD